MLYYSFKSATKTETNKNNTLAKNTNTHQTHISLASIKSESLAGKIKIAVEWFSVIFGQVLWVLFIM